MTKREKDYLEIAFKVFLVAMVVATGVILGLRFPYYNVLLMVVFVVASIDIANEWLKRKQYKRELYKRRQKWRK